MSATMTLRPEAQEVHIFANDVRLFVSDAILRETWLWAGFR